MTYDSVLATRMEPFIERCNEKDASLQSEEASERNPVVTSSERVYKVRSQSFPKRSNLTQSQAIDLVKINDEGVKHAARHVRMAFRPSLIRIEVPHTD